MRVSGPLFDGQADAAVQAWIKQVKKDGARQAQSIIQSKARRWNRSGRGGTGVAAEHVKTADDGEYYLVYGRNDKGEVWWPWLEGTSRRNTSTRFKGYHAFRLAKNIVAKRIRQLGEDDLRRYIEQMGGRP